jgi:hypothetical protein
MRHRCTMQLVELCEKWADQQPATQSKRAHTSADTLQHCPQKRSAHSMAVFAMFAVQSQL